MKTLFKFIAAIFVISLLVGSCGSDDQDTAEEKPVITEEEQVEEKPAETEAEQVEETTEEIAVEEARPAYDTVIFGNYAGEALEWRVLDKNDSATLLITQSIIDYKEFNESTQADATDWENSTLRNWLNEDLYYSAFSDEERNAIQTATVQDFKEDHQAGEQTQDHIFILSVDQAFSYFESDEDRIAHATEYAKQQKKYPQDSYWLIDSYSSDLYKYLVSPKGILDNKPRVNESEGIRPAMWVSNNVLN